MLKVRGTYVSMRFNNARNSTPLAPANADKIASLTSNQPPYNASKRKEMRQGFCFFASADF